MKKYTQYQLSCLKSHVEKFNDTTQSEKERNIAMGYVYGIQCDRDKLFIYRSSTDTFEKTSLLSAKEQKWFVITSTVGYTAEDAYGRTVFCDSEGVFSRDIDSAIVFDNIDSAIDFLYATLPSSYQQAYESSGYGGHWLVDIEQFVNIDDLKRKYGGR